MKMREMLRCLICGRGAWPTMIAKGQLGVHQIESLLFVKGLGKGRGIKWEKRDRSTDVEFLNAWLDILDKVSERLEQRISSLTGEEFDRWHEKPKAMGDLEKLKAMGDLVSPKILKERSSENPVKWFGASMKTRVSSELILASVHQGSWKKQKRL